MTGRELLFVPGIIPFAPRLLITVDAGEDTLRRLFAEVREAGRSYCDYCMSWRNDNPIHLARGSIATVESVWPRVRHYE